MKIYILSLFFFISFIAFAQNNHIVKTDDGRRVLLKEDFTWEYIDLEKKLDSPTTNTSTITVPLKKLTCGITEDFTEPKLNGKIQSQLKKGRATIKHVKEKVAKDNNCSVADVILVSAREQKTKAVYNFCAKGKSVTYKRIGNSIVKKSELF